jgi:hypothetical protein
VRKGVNLTGELVLRRLDEKSGLTWAELAHEFGSTDERSGRLNELLDCFDALFNTGLIYISTLSPDYTPRNIEIKSNFLVRIRSE